MTPAKRARMVMVAAYMGALGTVLAALAILLHWPDFFRGFPVGLLVASLFILLNRSLRDEYFQELWAAGTSWAFVAVIAWTIGVPIYLGTFVGSREHAWLAPLWIREVVSEGGSLRDLLVHDLAPQIARVLADRFAVEQAAGRLNPALDPRLLMVSVVGLTLFPAAGTPIWRQIFDSDDLGIDDIRRHALALLLRGLELPQ